ncbi:MAG: reverse transcriptase domain-containing protein, partial [Candidatus Thiodiazotropha sp.]
KLLMLGIGGNFYRVVKYMYSNSKFVVKKDNFLSKAGKSERGVRQGDGLSPLLFNIFINHIDEIFDQTTSDPVVVNSTKLNCLIYADDVLLLSESKEGLQSCLNALQVYCDYWKLQINVEKTKVMIFSVGKIKKENMQFKIYDSVIEIVEKYKYLGILLSYNGNLKHAAEHMYQKSLKAIFSLKSKILDYDSMSNKLKLRLFDALIRPILTYGAEIWISDYTIKDKTLDTLPFEKLQNRFCKYLLGVHKKSSNLASRLEFGREPTINFIYSQVFKYYTRLCQLPDNRLLKEVFELDKSLFHDGYRSWYSSMQTSMEKMSITDLDAQSSNISKIISSKYSSRINKELTVLRNQVHDNKLNTFSQIYTQFSLQNYLTFGLPKSKTKELSKLRISSHDLLIERGRYFRPKVPRENRLCMTCNKIEDEEHFMIYCSRFSMIRNDLFTRMNIDCNDVKPNTGASSIILNRLLNPANIEETKFVCNFISSALCIRSN